MRIGMRRKVMVNCVLLVNNEKKDVETHQMGGRVCVIVLNRISS